jgi:hypothetical protein
MATDSKFTLIKVYLGVRAPRIMATSTDLDALELRMEQAWAREGDPEVSGFRITNADGTTNTELEL